MLTSVIQYIFRDSKHGCCQLKNKYHHTNFVINVLYEGFLLLTLNGYIPPSSQLYDIFFLCLFVFRAFENYVHGAVSLVGSTRRREVRIGWGVAELQHPAVYEKIAIKNNKQCN
jgi:hypothetical protein